MLESGRMNKYQEALESLAEKTYGYEEESYVALQELIDRNSWIPVSERLPDEDFTDALTCDKHGNIHILRHYSSQRLPFGIKRSNPNLFMPIAWQPLPEPWKERQE